MEYYSNVKRKAFESVSNEVDETRARYTEWSKPERERQTSYINTYIRNLERWYGLPCVQGNKGDTDLKNRLLDSVGGVGGMIWENSIETYTLTYVKLIAIGSLTVAMALRISVCIMVWDLCAWWIEPHTDGKRHCFIWKRSKENSPIYCSIENNKILRNKFNQRGEGSLHWRLQDIDERRRCKQMERYPIFTAMVFPCSHVQMWELDQKEGWVPKYCRFQFVVLKTLESPLNSKEIKPVNSKGNQPWIFTGRTNAEAPILWPPDTKNQLWKRPWY